MKGTFLLRFLNETEHSASYDAAHLQSQHSRGRDRLSSVNLRPAWSTVQIPGQAELYNETLSLKKEGGGAKFLKVRRLVCD